MSKIEKYLRPAKLLHYSRTITPENISKAANLVGELVLKGLGVLGKIITAPLIYSDPSANIYKSPKLLKLEKAILAEKERLVQKASTWLSPLNYTVAVLNGHGLNAEKGEKEISSWSPIKQTLGRVAEIYVTPKVVKGTSRVVKGVPKTASKVARKVSPTYDLYKTIDETTPRATQTFHDFRLNGQTQKLLMMKWPESNSSASVLNWNNAVRMLKLQQLIPKYNEFAKLYGYKIVPKDMPIQKAENLIKEGLKLHNTFYRGLTFPEGENLKVIKEILGENASRENIMDYLAKSGSRDPNNTYFSPDERVNQYAKTGDVARYTRKYTLGNNPLTWIEDADFSFDTTPATSFAPRGSVNYPWADSSIKVMPGEVRINPEDVIFEGWMPKTKWEYGEYVKPSLYNGSKKYFEN